jgi:outer membrane protein assembly factor BamB
VSRLLLPACLAAFFALAPAALADNWPQWRGPKNDGVSNEKGLPTEWGPEKNVAWKLKLPGRGGSTPCVWGDRIFLTAQDAETVHLLCVGTDGREKWRRPMGPAFIYRQPDGDNATASCSTDGARVWAFAGGGKLACFTVDGAPVWEKNLQDYGKFSIQFGTHWTPLLHQGKLYLQVMHRNAQKLVRLDAATGHEDWAVNRKGFDRGESPDVYASPFVWEGEGGPLVIAHGNDYCTAHKLDDGAEVWRVAGLNPSGNGAWRFISCPLVTPNLIVVPSCKSGPTVGINPVGAKGTIDPENKAELWRLPFKAGVMTTPDVVSPLLVGDVIYLMSDGPLTAIDAKTGAQVYRQDLTRGVHRANLVAADGKVYSLAREGTADVVQAGREFEPVAKNVLPDKFTASPAISGGRVYLHGWEYLWAIGSK